MTLPYSSSPTKPVVDGTDSDLVTTDSIASVPMRLVGPMQINGQGFNEALKVPLATYETPLWHSVGRGARVSNICGGITTNVVDERMTRSILLEADDAISVLSTWQQLKNQQDAMQQEVSHTSRFAKLLNINEQIVGNLLYLRLEFSTGDAAGHNMVTQAAEVILNWILKHCPQLRYCSISGNYCSDKKATAVNGILGRGKYVIADILIPRSVCLKQLRATPEKIVDLNIKKNLIGSLIAGSIRSANAHYANMLLGFYLATGQDAANIIEGSQGITHTEVRGEDLYFSCTLPNLIVGSVGNGKELAFVQRNLELLGCAKPLNTDNTISESQVSENEPSTKDTSTSLPLQHTHGHRARKLAQICAATVLCGELSLLAAQTNPGELMRTHIKLERQTGKKRASTKKT